MYNADLKSRFIKEYVPHNISKSQHIASIFDAFESYEYDWNADLCTRSGEELQPIFNKLMGLRYTSHSSAFIILRDYCQWCIDNKIPGARNGMLDVHFDSLERVRDCMVSGPLHLKKFMDEILEKECDLTSHILYRCYYWMAFSGLYEEDVFNVTIDEIKFDSMIIEHNEVEYPLYRESIITFKNAVSLTGFYYNHPRYEEPAWRERKPGNILLRGFRGNLKMMTTRSWLSNLGADALKKGNTKQQLSYSRIWLSGLFYRTYERELDGYSVSFTDAAIKQMEGKTYKDNNYRLNSIINNYEKDYQRWKQAFYS